MKAVTIDPAIISEPMTGSQWSFMAAASTGH